MRREAAAERAKLLVARLAMVVKYDELGEHVLAGRIRWRRENGRCAHLPLQIGIYLDRHAPRSVSI